MTFQPDPQIQTIVVPAEFAPYVAGTEPLRIEVRTNLTLAEAFRLNEERPPDLASVFALYAPFVVGWNVDATPPAEGGPDQFRELPHLTARYLVVEVIQLLRAEAVRVITISNEYGVSRAKLATPPSSTPAA